MSKILTVIVPSYNMEKYLPKCLGSLVVAPELMDRLEVLVVNDGSKDRTSEIAHEFAEKYPQTFKVIDKANGNYGSCINAALPRVTGVYVKVLDADDYVETEVFAQSIGILAREVENGDSAIDLLVTNYDQVDEEGNVIVLCDYKIGSEGCRTLAEVPEGTLRFTVHSIAYKTENLRKINYRQTEGISYTDTEWIIEPMVTVRKFYYLPRVGAHYLVGRVGQTMEVVTFAKKFQQVVDIVSGLLVRYNKLCGIAEIVSLSYYRRQVERMVEMVYCAGILGLEQHRPDCDLVSFDKFMMTYPDYYRWTESFCVRSRLFTFYYVKEWRRSKSRDTLKFFLLGCYEKLSLFRRSMLSFVNGNIWKHG